MAAEILHWKGLVRHPTIADISLLPQYWQMPSPRSLLSRAFVGTWVALACGSCTNIFVIEASRAGSATKLTLYEPGILYDSSLEECLTEVTVYEEDRPRRAAAQPVWKIAAQKGCVPTKSVLVGSVPDGFVSVIDYVPLQVGGTYGAWAASAGRLGSSSPFRVCREFVETLNWVTEHELEKGSSNCFD